MDQKVLYSVMGLAAMPMVQTVAQNQNWTGTTMTVAQATAVSDASTAEPTSFNIGKLAPGYYNLACQVTSKVYDVTVKVTGAKETKSQVCNNPSTTPQDVNVAFQVEDDTKDIVISFESSDKGESGSAFSFTAPTVSLSFTFSTIKTTLANNAQALANTIAGYNYAAKQEDVENAGKLKTKAENIQSSYEDYKKYKLYAEKSTIQEEIDQLAASAAAKEATYQNEQAYGRVNAAITAIKAKYNTAVAELEGALVGAAAYLLDDAKAELNEKINEKITEATQASYASYQAGTAVADETTNTGKVPTETALNNIVNNWKGQATNNINAYNTLHAIVTGLQADLDAIVPASDAIAALFPKTECQAAIDAINTKVENAKNSAAQLSLDVNSDKTAAQTKISTLAGKVNAANAEFNANKATTEAIAAVQKKLNDAKTAVNAKVSKDGQYKAQDYYAKYVEDVQKEINQLTTDAAAAYKVDGTGTAQTYNAGLSGKITPIEGEISDYQTNAIDAVTKYDALMTAINGTDAEHPGYQGQLDAARAQFVNLPIYEDEKYDYKTKLDLIQKRINDITKAINAAKEKVGDAHWTAMLAIDIDAAITTDIQNLLNNKQKDQNQYDKDSLVNGITSLQTRIATFTGDATLAKLGADYAAFAAAETTINGKVTAVETDRAAIDPEAADAATKINGLNVRVANIKAEQDALEAAANAVKDRVTANTTAKTTLASSIGANDVTPKTGLFKEIDDFKTTYKIGQADSDLGNRGKATGEITNKVSEILSALTSLKGSNDAFVPTTVKVVDKDVATEGLENGVYDVKIEVKAQAAGTASVNYTQQAFTGDGTFQLNNVFVYDGTLKIEKGGATSVEVKELKFHENDQLSTYNAVDDKPNEDPDTDGYATKFNKLNNQLKALVDDAPRIKTLVENNADANDKAQVTLTALGTYKDKLKNLDDVSDADGNYDETKAKKTDPANWYVYKSDLPQGTKNYADAKAEVEDLISKMTSAITSANNAEELPYPWADEITTKVDNKDVTYKKSDIEAAIDAIKTKAGDESKNYWAYRDIRSGADNTVGKTQKVDDASFTTSIAAARNDLATKAGAGAYNYYNDLIGDDGATKGYTKNLKGIRDNMVNSLKARTAVNTQAGFVNNLKDLKAKIDKVQGDAAANLAKYTEQKSGDLGYEKTQTLWNNTYTEIAATDHSSQVQIWLDQLDAIQVDLTAATNAVEDNYKAGKSVEGVQDFAAIQARINDVKAQQSVGYNEQIAKDNAAAHAAFNAAIAAATSAYQTAVRERAQYSTTNETIKTVVDGAAATLDATLYSYPTDIATLTNLESLAYAAVTSPTVFDASTYLDDAKALKDNIETALGTFKTDVKTALNGFWNGANYRPTFQNKVTNAVNAIADYSDAAKTDAFKDVVDLIAKGDAGVNSLILSDIEAAIEGLENIDNMLATDKDAAAVKDLTPRFAEVEQKYTEVKDYINGVTIADDVDNVRNKNLNDLENAYDDGYYYDYDDVAYAKTLAKTFGNRNTIKGILDNFITTANTCKSNVETAVNNDVNNTKAYNEMMEAIVPVEAKLKEAKEAAAPYKYQTSFATQDSKLATLKSEVQSAKTSGGAVNYQTNTFNTKKNALDTGIETTLTTAFGTEKTGLGTDVTELKNQYNAYVAENGLDETATAFKAAIDDLQAKVTAAAIKDLDDPEDGIQFDEIVAATEALIELQYAIADKETELLNANNNKANETLKADFTDQLGDLAATASLEGNDPWVGNQYVSGKKISTWIAEINAEITELQNAINAEPNLSFYKDQYQAQIDAIETNLTPVVAAIAQKQDQFDANAKAYATLTGELQNLQDKLTAAKEKVMGYKYAKETGKDHSGKSYWNLIEKYSQDYWWEDYYLSGGVQYNINNASNQIKNANNNVSLPANSNINNYINVVNAENAIQQFLDEAAYYELTQQINALTNNLYYAYDAASHEGKQKYSAVLWNKMIAENSRIFGLIGNLSWDVDYSYTHDYWNGYKWIDKRSDRDYAEQMAIVADIQDQIDSFADAVDNIGLLGDANENGSVEVVDYQKVMNMILNPAQQPAGDTNLFANIDINQNEIVEVGDLTAIVNYILTHEWAPGYSAVKGFESPDERLTMTSEMQQGVQRFAINLQNVEDYTAFQLDVLLPEGMEIVGSSLSDRAGQSHKLYSRNQLDGSIRFLASSILGESFNGNEGAVLYIDVKTTSEFKGGSVELLNVLFSDTSAQTRVFTLGADGEATGIDIMSSIESLKQRVYDLGGRMMNGMRKGINIIQGADGTSKKVLK